MWWFSYLHASHTGNHHVVACLQNTFFFLGIQWNIWPYFYFQRCTFTQSQYGIKGPTAESRACFSYPKLCHPKVNISFISWRNTVLLATCVTGQEANFLSCPCNTFSLHLYIWLLSLWIWAAGNRIIFCVVNCIKIGPLMIKQILSSQLFVLKVQTQFCGFVLCQLNTPWGLFIDLKGNK